MNWRSHLSSTDPKGRCTVGHTGKWPEPVNWGADDDPLCSGRYPSISVGEPARRACPLMHIRAYGRYTLLWQHSCSTLDDFRDLTHEAGCSLDNAGETVLP
jgi:hypothetical protein